MTKQKNVTVTEIYSVALIRPEPSETKKKYSPYVPKYQLIYKISGEVVTHFNGKTVHIFPGMVYLIPKCQHADYSIERPVVGDCIDIFFDTDIPFLDELFCLDFSNHQKMKASFQTCYHLWISKAEGSYFKILSLVYEILYEMMLKNKKYLPSQNFQKIESGVEYLQNHLYDHKMDYYLPSKLCGISYTYFKKLFIEKFSVPPVQYVSNLRLERAAELLLTNQYSVSEIAEMCGFENVYYFSKKFKEKYRYAPSHYKALKMQKTD